MITNIGIIAKCNGGKRTMVSPGSYDDEYFDRLCNDDDTTSFAINTLRSNLSLSLLSLQEMDDPQNLGRMPEGVVVTPDRASLQRQTSGTTLNSKKRRLVKSPFLDTPLPIPRFNCDDDTDDSRYNSKLELKSCDISLATQDESHAGGGSPSGEQLLRRSKRQRKPVDLCKRNLETGIPDPSPFDSEVEIHPCSASGKLRSIHHSARAKEDTSDGDSSVPEGEYVIQGVLRRRIKADAEVPCYEYLIKWKPSWQPEEVKKLALDRGAWNLEKILDRRCRGGKVEVKCQWAPSWEPEDNLNDEALREAQVQFLREAQMTLQDGNNNNKNDDHDGGGDHDRDDDSLSDDALQEAQMEFLFGNKNSDTDDEGDDDDQDNDDDGDHYQTVREYAFNVFGNNESDDDEDDGKDDDKVDNKVDDNDDDDDDDDAVEKYGFDGREYDTYLDMCKAKQERNRKVLRRIMGQRMNESCDDK